MHVHPLPPPLRRPTEITTEEYQEFYKSMSKDTKESLAHTHFIAEGEVTFKALLFVPAVQPSESFNKYGTATDNIKLYVRRVFITDDFQVGSTSLDTSFGRWEGYVMTVGTPERSVTDFLLSLLCGQLMSLVTCFYRHLSHFVNR